MRTRARFIRRYPDPHHDAPNQLPLTTEALATIVGGTQSGSTLGCDGLM